MLKPHRDWSIVCAGGATIIHARNVCEALPFGLTHLLRDGEQEESRAGPVRVSPGPVITVTERPRERVLFSDVRDANPFFHLVEALWMLAGRDDAATLNRYVADFGERFAESASGQPNAEAGGWIHGAYGTRWRSALGFDQLDHVVGALRGDPTSRQCVIQMWDAMRPGEDDFAGGSWGSDDLRGVWRDRPCNTHVYLRVRPTEKLNHYSTDSGVPVRDTSIALSSVLDLTVCCRSNDAIWGAHGANAVHFSVLQEYLAARIGVAVGTMYQVSNNYHAYETEIEKLRARAVRLRGEEGRLLQPDLPSNLLDDRYVDDFDQSGRLPPMFDRPEAIDQDLRTFFEYHDAEAFSTDGYEYANGWFPFVAVRVVGAHHQYKRKNYSSALMIANRIEDVAWQAACVDWIRRRVR